MNNKMHICWVLGLLVTIIMPWSNGLLLAKKKPETRTEECSIERIHIVGLGKGGDAEQLIFLLEGQLTRHGFEVVGDSEEADALLNGTTTTKERVRGSSSGSVRGDSSGNVRGSSSGHVSSKTEGRHPPMMPIRPPSRSR